MLLRSKKKIKLLIFLLLLFIILAFTQLLLTPRLITNFFTDIRILTCQPKFDKHETDYFLKVKNLIEGAKLYLKNGCNYPEFKIEIKFKNLNNLRKIREEALQRNSLLSKKNKFFPVEIYYNNTKYKAELKFKGVRLDHINQNKQWSFKIKLKNNKYINGMKEFSITKFSSRQYPDSVFFSKYLRQNNFITPNFFIFKVKLNGENWGPMLVEEHFSSSYKELKKIRDIPIMTLSDGSALEIMSIYEKIYNYNYSDDLKGYFDLINHKRRLLTQTFNFQKYIKKNDTKSFNLISLAKTIHEISIVDKKKINIELLNYIDLDQIAFLIANSLIWEEGHSLGDDNFRIFVDPFSEKIQYIPTDHFVGSIDVKNLNSIREFFNTNYHFSLFIDNTELHQKYLNYLNVIEKDLQNQQILIDELCVNFIAYCNSKLKIQNAKNNIKILKEYNDKIFTKLDKEIYDLSNLSSDEISFLNKIYNQFDYQDLSIRFFDDGTLEIYNLTSFEIFLDKIVVKNNQNPECDSYESKIQKKISNSLEKSFKKVNINFKKKFCLMDEVILSINLLDTNKEKQIFTYVESSIYKTEFFGIYKKNNFDELNLNHSHGIIKSGKIIIDRPIILDQKDLIIESGAELVFKNNAYIYILNGNLTSIGTKDDPIILRTDDDSWGGLFVSNSENSVIEFTNIYNTNYFNHNNIMLTGAINFYNSNVRVLNSKFINSKAEDSINFINTNFEFISNLLSNTSSDGIDSDFSIGLIADSEFKEIKGDGIDLSGSNILIENTTLNIIDDKAISIGEKSDIKINNLYINNSKYGIANKDGSKLEGTNIKILNSKDYDILAFTKKPYYSMSKLLLDNVFYNQKKTLIETGHSAKINNRILNTQKIDLKLLYE